MKKMYIFMLAAVVTASLALASCGKKNAGTSTSASSSAGTEESGTVTTEPSATESRSSEEPATPPPATERPTVEGETSEITGTVVDAAMHSVIITSDEDGIELMFDTDGVDTELKEGLLVGEKITVVYVGEIKGNDTTGVTVVTLKDEE